jgi:diguanylate cyclase (GGDEF)-like protein
VAYHVLITSTMIVAGAMLLALSLYPTTSIIRELAPGPTQFRWSVLRGFIVVFIAGYLVCLVTFSSQPEDSHLIVSVIFFLGSFFVVLVSFLANGTVTDIKRIATLEAETITDPLMEIYNRRYFERRLEEEFLRAKRYGFPLSLLMLDIDHFKKVNDEHGHPAGDLVLKGLGDVLKRTVRNVDVPSRYGGEEVAVILPHTSAGDAGVLASRIGRAIAGNPVPIDVPGGPGLVLHYTVSIGVAAMTTDCAKAAQLLEMADTAMYRAKRDGRSRTVIYSGEKEGVEKAEPRVVPGATTGE